MKFVILFMLSVVAGQRKNFIQNLVTQIKNSPRHKSASPSFNGERKFDVIGTAELPLQSDIKVSEILYYNNMYLLLFAHKLFKSS